MERLLIIKFSISLILIVLIQMDGYNCCLEKERNGLLEIKSFFISSSYTDGILTSWVDGDPMSDCCCWERVKCNATTGRVMEFSLNSTRRRFLSAGAPLLNWSLFHPFEELQSLDLSFNYFQGLYENKDYNNLGSLKQLKLLNLGYNYFNDSILPYLNTLTSLTTLNLRSNKIEGPKTKQGLANLRNLQVLDLSYNSNITSGSLARLGLTNLTNLTRLELRSCGITTIQGLENLTNLRRLELSSCGITAIQGLANLKNLQLLDLSGNSIRGSVSGLGICELENLLELNLMENNFDGHLPWCLKNLSRLKVFDISSNQLSGNLPSVIANLTSLEYLALSDNNFQGIFSLTSLANHSNLEYLLLLNINNKLRLNVQEYWLPTFQLKVLHLSNCYLNILPSFLLHQYELKFLDLSHNKLVGNLPIWLLQNNTKLQVLFLANNSLSGVLQLPKAKHDLLRLDISSNSFTGKLPQNIGIIFKQLVDMKISKNYFEGKIPYSIGEMKELGLLDLSRNNFSGELSQSILTGLYSLQILDLSNNNFYGQIFAKYMNLTQLCVLYLGNNHFSGKINDGLLKSANLMVLDISNNMFSGDIPHWIGNFTLLRVLLMSNNHLEGGIPIQLNNLEELKVLDLSENSLSGSLIASFNLSWVNHLYLQKNALSGLIPGALFRSSVLKTLDLRDNKFSGRIPHQINEYSIMSVLLLRGNNLEGYIPNQLCLFGKLSIIDLSHNRLNGSIPSCFGNMLFRRVGTDDLYGSQLVYFTNLPVSVTGNYYRFTLKLGRIFDYVVIYTSKQEVEVEFVTKNRHEFYKGGNIQYMSGLDLSCNALTGEIPTEIGKLEKIHGLNLSHNFLSGNIPESFSNLKMIESLDLSHNELSGQIPPQLIGLNFLSNFNVSYNNLYGPTPDKGQFGTFVESSYRGNPNLCGSLINNKCSITSTPAGGEDDEDEDESAIDMVALYWSFGASYMTVILGLFAILWINSYWRKRWFYFIDRCIDTCYYWLFKYVFYR